LRLTILSFLWAGGAMSQKEGGTLLGKWRSVVVSKGGIGAIVDFHADGTFDYSPGAVLGGRYRIEGKSLILALDDGEPEDKQTIESLTAGALRLGPLDFRRVGRAEDAANLLLGVWITVKAMPGMPGTPHGYYYFRRDGRQTFVIPFLTDHCTYAVSGDRIRLTNRQGTKEGPMRWDGAVLTLPWGRNEATFQRF